MTLTCDTQRETILVVDDNFGIRGFAKVVLENAGYTVITAADGEEALRLHEKHQSSIALMLTDVVMPNLNGFELAARVLEIDSQLPVLFMSGRYAGIVFRGLECLAKPFRPTELVEKVSRALNVSAQTTSAVSGAVR
jgi:two-component system cell cycle sensor histidine kinase/response regulator CckA